MELRGKKKNVFGAWDCHCLLMDSRVMDQGKSVRKKAEKERDGEEHGGEREREKETRRRERKRERWKDGKRGGYRQRHTHHHGSHDTDPDRDASLLTPFFLTPSLLPSCLDTLGKQDQPQPSSFVAAFLSFFHCPPPLFCFSFFFPFTSFPLPLVCPCYLVQLGRARAQGEMEGRRALRESRWWRASS